MLRSGHSPGFDMAMERGYVDLPGIIRRMRSAGMDLPSGAVSSQKKGPVLFQMGGKYPSLGEKRVPPPSGPKLQEGFRTPETNVDVRYSRVPGPSRAVPPEQMREIIESSKTLTEAKERIRAATVVSEAIPLYRKSGSNFANVGKFEGEIGNISFTPASLPPGAKFIGQPAHRFVRPPSELKDATKRGDTFETRGTGLEGGAAKADPSLTPPMEIILPFPGFRGGGQRLGPSSSYLTAPDDPSLLALLRGQMGPEALKMPGGKALTKKQREKMIKDISDFDRGMRGSVEKRLGLNKGDIRERVLASRYAQLLGPDLRNPSPVDFLVTAVPRGPLTYPMETTMRLAQELEIPIFNLAGNLRSIERAGRPARMPSSDFEAMLQSLANVLPS